MDLLPWGNRTELLFFSGFIVPSEGLFSVLLEKEAREDTLGLYCPPPLTDFLAWKKKKCTYSCSLSEQVTCCKIVLEHSEHCALENGSLLSAGIVLLGFCFLCWRGSLLLFSATTQMKVQPIHSHCMTPRRAGASMFKENSSNWVHKDFPPRRQSSVSWTFCVHGKLWIKWHLPVTFSDTLILPKLCWTSKVVVFSIIAKDASRISNRNQYCQERCSLWIWGSIVRPFRWAKAFPNQWNVLIKSSDMYQGNIHQSWLQGVDFYFT